MKKLTLLITFLLIPALAFSAQWDSTFPIGTTLIPDLATDSGGTPSENVPSLDRLLQDYREGIKLTYKNASEITITSGQITVDNATNDGRLMMELASNVDIDWSDIDTGAEAGSTDYFVYAIASSATATTATFKISENSSAPNGVTYYKRIGTFTNDGSSNITVVSNDNFKQLRDTESKSDNVVYQATTDGYFIGVIIAGANVSAGRVIGYSDSNASPTTVRGGGHVWVNLNNAAESAYLNYNSFSIPVKSGDYYKGVKSSYPGHNAPTVTYYFIPFN